MRTARVAAAAALGFLSGPAALHAQAPAATTTQVYGLVDLALASTVGVAGGANAADRRLRQLLNGGLSTSHLGFRGSEDLGGGVKVQFDLSSFLRADTGAAGRNDAIGAPVNLAADPFWSRQAWVGITSASWGRLRWGNTSTLLFVNAISSNPFGDSTAFSPLVLATFIGSPLTGGTGWKDQVSYDSPNMGGLVLSGALSASEGNGGRNWAARAAWSAGPLAASFVIQDVKRNPGSFADGTSPNNTRAWQLAGSWDLKTVKLFAHLGRIGNHGTEVAPLSVNYRLWELGASVPVGAGRVLAAYADRRTGDTPVAVPATAPGGNVSRRIATLGYDHDLSRRTDAYALVMHDRTQTRTLPAPPTVLKAGATSVALGLRHRF